MFDDCNTLAELNAARIQYVSKGVNLLDVNNAYNIRRQEILNSRSRYIKLTPITATPREVTLYCGVPVAGRSKEKGVIKFTKEGFLY